MPVEGLKTQEDFNRMFVPEELEVWGDRWGHRWRGLQRLRHRLCVRMVEEFFGTCPTLKVLDIGCGQCDFLLRLHRRHAQWKLFGTDIAGRVIQWNASRYPFIRFEAVGLPQVGFPGEWFDLICALEVLVYLEDAEKREALGAIHEALAPGGFFFFSGALDGGARYFNEEKILSMTGEYFTIRAVRYHYTRTYVAFERPQLALLAILRRMGELLALEGGAFTQWCLPRPRWKRRLMRGLRLGGIRQAGCCVARGIGWVIRQVLRSEVVPRVCAAFDSTLFPQSGRTQMLVMARKEDS